MIDFIERVLTFMPWVMPKAWAMPKVWAMPKFGNRRNCVRKSFWTAILRSSFESWHLTDSHFFIKKKTVQCLIAFCFFAFDWFLFFQEKINCKMSDECVTFRRGVEIVKTLEQRKHSSSSLSLKHKVLNKNLKKQVRERCLNFRTNSPSTSVCQLGEW